MNSRATSVMAWRLHRSAIAVCLVYFREIDPTAFWVFCNTILPKTDVYRTSSQGGLFGFNSKIFAYESGPPVRRESPLEI
jgi:hypothetical protein